MKRRDKINAIKQANLLIEQEHTQYKRVSNNDSGVSSAVSSLEDALHSSDLGQVGIDLIKRIGNHEVYDAVNQIIMNHGWNALKSQGILNTLVTIKGNAGLMT